jgi:hypothetical protein
MPELENEKFIISGRKGSGKTAIAEHIYELASEDPNTFCDFVRKGEFDIQKVTQIGKEVGHELNETLLYEWLILTKLLQLVSQNESATDKKLYKDLNLFIKKNSGFVNIKNYEIKEVLKKEGIEIKTNYFDRVFSVLFKKDTESKHSKAPFYKLIPSLKETLKKLLQSDQEAENEYIVIFDDLDIGFSFNQRESIDSLINLIRISRDYNHFFGKEKLGAKIIILIRDDIGRFLKGYDAADTAKMLSSYEIPISWYEQETFNKRENDVKLKKFINKRLMVNYEKNGVSYDPSDPWNSLIANDLVYASNSSFKYIIDYTFFRPRDLVLFFKPLSENDYPIPLTSDIVQTLLTKLCDEIMSEVKNELSAHYESTTKNLILGVLKKISLLRRPFSFSELSNELSKVDIKIDPKEVTKTLFEYSLIGNIDNSVIPPRIYFKHREKRDEVYNPNFDLSFIIHHCLERYNKK